MNDDVLALLKVHDYFKGASDEALQELVKQARLAQHPAGTVVHEANAPLVDVGFVLRGRLKAVRVDVQGRESLFRMIERGEQFGMMIGAVNEPVPIRVVALEPATVLMLDWDIAFELTARYPELRRLWLTGFAGSLKKHFFGAAPRKGPMILALLHDAPATRWASRKLASRLGAVGEKIAVLSDVDDWQAASDVRFRPMPAGGGAAFDEVRRQIGEWQDAHRIVFDLPIDAPADQMQRLMELADRVVYFAPGAVGDGVVRRLQGLGVDRLGWRDKVSVAWLLDGAKPIGPLVPNLGEVACRDFKLTQTPVALPWGRSVDGGIERIVHDLRGVRIGVALGGGAARGMVHLGVLKALEQNGIVVDAIAGTSAGAMCGIFYASGLDPDYSAEQFSRDLRPSWIFRHLPKGDNWYLVYKYRSGQFDPMLRKYIHDWRLEQLPVPCMSVTVDLVSGNSIVRQRGDATHAILESINLPVVSVPICRQGQILVDGGLVNNIPADVLVSQGCNFVIAVSVTAKMEHEFCNVTADKPAAVGRPSIVQTLLRSLLVQNHCLNATGVQPADFVIEPDVTRYQLTDFVKTRELAAIGEAAALEQIPKIQQLLTRLDSNTFRFPPTSTIPGSR